MASEYNNFPAVDENLHFPPAVNRALIGSQEFIDRFGKVDNTPDTEKPISTSTQDALNKKAPLANPAFTGTPTGINKGHVGLGKVDNTSDTEKPVSNAVKAAYVPRWTAGTTYAIGDQVISPTNKVVTATANHTASAAFLTDVAKWGGSDSAVPYGFMGRTQGFQPLSTSTPIVVVMAAAQELRGGMTFNAANGGYLTVPVAGRYNAHLKGMFSGSAGEINQMQIVVNDLVGSNAGNQFGKLVGSVNKAGGGDIHIDSSGEVTLKAGDKIALAMMAAANAWGTTGYNGSYLELKYIGD